MGTPACDFDNGAIDAYILRNASRVMRAWHIAAAMQPIRSIPPHPPHICKFSRVVSCEAHEFLSVSWDHTLYIARAAARCSSGAGQQLKQTLAIMC